MKLPNCLSRLWSRWRNLDALAAAQLRTAYALRDAQRAQEQAEASQQQLAVSRALLAVTMRERDQAQANLQRMGSDLAWLVAKQRSERRNSRLWVTRCSGNNVSQN